MKLGKRKWSFEEKKEIFRNISFTEAHLKTYFEVYSWLKKVYGEVFLLNENNGQNNKPKWLRSCKSRSNSR